MKKNITLAILLVVLQLGYAQVDNSNTFTDITLAKAYAEKKDLPMLMIFAGSDWCKPCIQFKKGILQSPVFMAYSDKNLAIIYLNFPLKKANKLSPEQTAHNEKLAEQYNPSGAFPEILMMDAHEQVLGKLSFNNQSPEVFIARCEALVKGGG